jgi:hypothetical protein
VVSLLPEVVAEEDDRVRARHIVARAKPAAQDRLDAEGLECRNGERTAADALGTPLFDRQVDRREAVRAHPLERGLTFREDRQVLHGDRLLSLVL